MAEGATKTESETYFETFGRRNGFALVPVPTGSNRTPDYTLTVGREVIVVEVKEVHQSSEERESDRVAKERGVGLAVNVTPGKTVRKKIADCSRQIKARTQGRYPGLLVLWERGLCSGEHTEAYHIQVAMAGFEQVVLAVPPIASGREASVVGMKHGPSRKMTENANTSISAVAVLGVPAKDQMLLQVFHNRHARIPLDPALLAGAEIKHYALRDDPNRTTEWHAV